MTFYQRQHPYAHIQKTDKHLVLDLDETLVHTFDDELYPRLSDLHLLTDPQYMNIRSRLYVLTLNNIYSSDSNLMWGIQRGGLRDFLEFASKYFLHTCVWSAGKYDYVHEVCKNIFRGMKPPTVIFTYDNCVNDKTHLCKPLVDMIKDPRVSATMSLSNTLVIDDRASTFVRNKQNGILIPAYSPQDTISDLQANDGVLEKVSKWLMKPEVVASKDVKLLDKSKIFV